MEKQKPKFDKHKLETKKQRPFPANSTLFCKYQNGNTKRFK